MNTTLPPLPPVDDHWMTNDHRYTADQMHAYAAAALAQTGAEPVAWLVDVAEHQNQYAVIDADDTQLMDDCTNHGATVTPLYLAPIAQPAPPDAAGWWALVMGAAASLEDAANCLRDPDAKRQAEGAAKHYREAAKLSWSQRAAPLPAREPLTDSEAVALMERADEDGGVVESMEAAMILVVRAVEAAHGITATKGKP